MKTFYIGFVILNLLIAVFYIDTWQNANTTSRVLPVVTFLETEAFRLINTMN